MKKKPWYTQAFQEDYLEIYLHRDLKEAERAAAFFGDLMRLERGHRLLDLCCGPGRHLVFLSRRVGQAVGLDLSRALLQRAGQHWQAPIRETAAAEKQKPRRAPAGAPPALIQGDMRRLPLADASFDRIVNLFTSFGYFESEVDNFAVLCEVARLLKPASGRQNGSAGGGLFMIDHINRESMLAGLRPQTERLLSQGRRLVEKRRWEASSRRVIKDITCSEPGGQMRAWRESVRVYQPKELAALLEQAGLRVCSRYGDYEGGAWSPAAPRLILLAEKK